MTTSTCFIGSVPQRMVSFCFIRSDPEVCLGFFCSLAGYTLYAKRTGGAGDVSEIGSGCELRACVDVLTDLQMKLFEKADPDA